MASWGMFRPQENLECTMKVAHVVVSGEIAGGQIICLKMIEALKKRGGEAIVISPTAGVFTHGLTKDQIPVHFLPFRKTYHFHNAFQLAGILKREGVHLVHTHGMINSNVHARIASRLAHVPYVSHIHIANVFNPNPMIRRYQVFLDNWTSGFSGQLIAVSEATKQSLVEQGILPDRIRVVLNGVNERLNIQLSREEVFKKLSIDQDSRLIGMVGRLCPVKGQEEFMMAMARVFRQIPEAIGIVIGHDAEFKGAYERKLLKMAEKLGFGRRMIFTGYQSDPISLIHAMEFFVLPSRAEGLPLVALEAMSLQKAVVASCVGGVSEAVQDGKTGILVPPENVDALTRAILKLLSDPPLSRTMGEAGRERVQKYFSEARMCERVLNVYDELIKNSHPHG